MNRLTPFWIISFLVNPHFQINYQSRTKYFTETVSYSESRDLNFLFNQFIFSWRDYNELYNCGWEEKKRGLPWIQVDQNLLLHHWLMQRGNLAIRRGKDGDFNGGIDTHQIFIALNLSNIVNCWPKWNLITNSLQ